MTPIPRAPLVAWYDRNRTMSKTIFDLVSEQAYYSQPISLRHPIVFYEGHIPAFSFNTLCKRGLGEPSIDARLETLFARGIDPSDAEASDAQHASASARWPSRDQVRQFAAEADRRVRTALERGDIERPGHPLLQRAEAAYAILEHESMHQETLLYMWHRLPLDQKRPPAGYAPVTGGRPPAPEPVAVPAGRATLGIDAGHNGFAWDNERPAFAVDVPAFALDRHNVTNAAYLEFVEAGGYGQAAWWRPDDWTWIRAERRESPLFWERHEGTWYWRGMFDLIPLPLSWPAYVTQAEATAFARWRGGRLPTEAEFQRAAYGTPSGAENHFPWGSEAATPARGVFDFASWDPQPAGSHPAGRSAWGIDDLVGNGWEWTSSPFAPFPGFVVTPSYPEYSADFFDDDHFVMKGASPVTPRELLRPTFRNWFRPRYPYMYATFRCAYDA